MARSFTKRLDSVEDAITCSVFANRKLESSGNLKAWLLVRGDRSVRLLDQFTVKIRHVFVDQTGPPSGSESHLGFGCNSCSYNGLLV